MKKSNIKDLGILSILNRFNVEIEIPKKVIEELKTIPTEVSKSELKGRTDLRDELIITIDGDDTKDIDDAISLTVLPNGHFKLGVHIADVTHYVKERSALDKMALNQATSIYPVNNVVPMLPKELSNGICSLNPDVDRLALSCIMEVDFAGEVVNYSIEETIIHSSYKMSYPMVSEILENENPYLIEKYEEVYPMLLELQKLTNILIKKRNKRGSLDFNCPETKFICDQNEKIIKVKPYDRNIATRLIEECMILCNETIATYCYNKNLPFIYRIHDDPDEEKLELFKDYMSCLGFKLRDRLRPKELQRLLKKIEKTPEEKAINNLLLRSLPKAVYSFEHSEHFGLASACYCHFTSPIRRYPDLQIHRIIKASINNKLDYKELKKYKKAVQEIDTHCSNQEQLSQKIERESVKLKSAEYMLEKIGEEYIGVISGINEFGFYVQLPNTIEGFVNIYSVKNDKYIYDELKLMLVGEKTRKTFKLGDEIHIQVKNVNLTSYQIDFILYNSENE